MCGIAGYWANSLAAKAMQARDVANRLEHRGPDSQGRWIDSDAGVVLIHRRLSILDLSEAGHQPMVSLSKRYVLTYNGEIYNHRELRHELEALQVVKRWRGSSDTETLLAGIAHWGVAETLKRLNGMFAFALWDRKTRTLTLARDRMGEKPLYYGRNGGVFLFGSELKALTACPGWRGEVNRDALALYLRHSYVPTPWSIYRGIYKLPPAHFVVIGEYGTQVGEPTCYWSLAEIAERGMATAVTEKNLESLVGELDSLLRDAVRRRMVADVPLGAFLSGGYGSTTVVALMQAQSDRPVRTFVSGLVGSS